MEEEATETLDEAVERMLDAKGRVPTYIDDLDDAVQVINGIRTLVTNKDGYIIVEKWISGGIQPRWLGTELYKVTRVDVQTGDVVLYDEGLFQTAQTNFLTGPKRGWRFKVPPVKGLNLKERSKADYLARVAKKNT